MTTRSIRDGLQEIYGVEVSPSLISAVTDPILEDVKAWQSLPLDAVYPLVFEAKWGERSPVVVRSWRSNRVNLTTCFDYPPELRKRKYRAMRRASVRWSCPAKDRARALNHPAVVFEGRVPP